MKKKVIMLLVAVMATIAAHAQFEAKKVYVGASLTGLNLSYSGSEKTSFGVEAKAGYLFADNWMVTAQVSYNKKNDVPSYFKGGAGLRYYFVRNGLYLGVGLNYLHNSGDYDDFAPGVQLGYAFFLSRTVTIEPEIYYDQSFKNHSDYSTVGLRIGVGVYL